MQFSYVKLFITVIGLISVSRPPGVNRLLTARQCGEVELPDSGTGHPAWGGNRKCDKPIKHTDRVRAGVLFFSFRWGYFTILSQMF